MFQIMRYIKLCIHTLIASGWVSNFTLGMAKAAINLESD